MVMAVARVRDDALFLFGGALLSVLEKCITCCELYADCAKRELPLLSPLLLLLEPRMRGLVCLACASMQLLLCLLAVPVSIIIVVVVKNRFASMYGIVMTLPIFGSLMPLLDGSEVFSTKKFWKRDVAFQAEKMGAERPMKRSRDLDWIIKEV
jgi:hypothetical protein